MGPNLLRRALICLAVTLTVGCQAIGQSSNVVRFSGNLSGAQQVPAVVTDGKGTIEATFDKATNILKWKVVHSGLSGPARAAHFHGNADPGQVVGVVLGFKSAESPIEGEATLTPEQASNLLAGKWYVNVHTAKNPGGEIRAHMVPMN